MAKAIPKFLSPDAEEANKTRCISIKPGSHRKIVKDNSPKTGKDLEIVSESG